MTYKQVEKATFLSRPNRFIAHVLLQEEEIVCHVKNTGRCKELLLPGATVYLAKAENPNRKTQYDLIAVEKGDRLINLDSQIPNAVAKEWLEQQPEITKIIPESRFGDSRFDFYLEKGNEKAYLEVKGVTLEENGVALFPDAPTIRGVKHLRGLTEAIRAGYHAYVLFVIQMKGISCFTPNLRTHPAFGEALSAAKNAGVTLLAFDCQVAPDHITLADPVEITLPPFKNS